jgi:tetratricopeptide (TPR) repeat protein
MGLFERQVVRSALRGFHDTDKLAQHPLTALKIAGGTGLVSDSSLGKTERANRLRAVLREAVESLRPDEGQPIPYDKRWRPYLILQMEYIRGEPPEQVGSEMSIARSQFHAEQAKALDRVADILSEREAGLDTSDRPISTDAGATVAGAIPPFSASLPSFLPIIGRDVILQQLKAQLLSSEKGQAIALSGLPGVGKTTLALHLALDPDVRNRFNAGMLWAGLGQKPDIHAILAAWAARLGVLPEALAQASSADELAELVHQAIGYRHIIVVIDDAWSSAAALALRVGGPYCAHILTTRFNGIAADFAHTSTVVVNELETEPALGLFTACCPRLAETHHDDVQAIVQATGGLPLTITLIGHHLYKLQLSGQTRRLQQALSQLRDPAHRLNLGEPGTALAQKLPLTDRTSQSLRVVIDYSVQGLQPGAKRALAMLSVLRPKPNSFTEEAALAICAESVEAIDALVDYGLLETTRDARYTMHQSIADYAHLALDNENAKAAEERTVAYYAGYVERNRHDYVAIDQEQRNVFDSVDKAFIERMPAWLVSMANPLYPYMEARGLYTLAREQLERARKSAVEIDDQPDLATTLLNLGRTLIKTGDFAQAQQVLREGLACARQVGEATTVAATLQQLGSLAENVPDYQRAEQYYEEGLAIARSNGDHEHTSLLLIFLSGLYEQLGRFTQSEQYAREALILATEANDRQGICTAMAALGVVCSKQGKFTEGTSYLLQSLTLAREIGHRETIALLLLTMGLGVARFGQFDQAEAMLSEGLATAKQIGYRRLVNLLTTGMGYLETQRGNYDAAHAYLDQALTSAKEIGHQWDLALVAETAGNLYDAEAKPDLAEETFNQCLAISERLGFGELAGYAYYRLAKIAAAHGRMGEAKQMGSKSQVILEAIGYWEAGAVREWVEQLLTGVDMAGGR